PIAAAAGHIKKNFGYPLRTPEQRYQRIDTLKAEHSIVPLCQAFEVSPSGYYDWSHRQEHPIQRHQLDQHFKAQISRIHEESRQTYGSLRVQVKLREVGQRHGRNRISRLMREQSLCG